MKKSNIALAALALIASTAAMAEGVQISGQFDVGLGNYTGQGTFMEQGAWSDHSSITFSANEDLGSGLSAFTVLEAGFDHNGYVANGGNGNLFSRQTLVGLKSADLGAISGGQQLSPYILAQALTNQGVGNFWVNRVIMAGGVDLGTSAGAAAGTANPGSGGFFMKNSVQYVSPNIAGFQLYALTALKSGADNGVNGGTLTSPTGNSAYTSFALSGNVAGANIWVATQNQSAEFKSWTVGATYQLLDQLNVSANYINHTVSGSTAVKSYALGATYKVTPAVSLVAQYARNNLDTAQSLYNVGAKYDFSKRTAAYITYGRATNGAISTIGARADYAATGVSNNATVVGITTSF